MGNPFGPGWITEPLNDANCPHCVAGCTCLRVWPASPAVQVDAATTLAELDHILGSVDIPHARNGVMVPIIERAEQFRDTVRRQDSIIEALKAGAPVIKCCEHCELCAAERDDPDNPWEPAKGGDEPGMLKHSGSAEAVQLSPAPDQLRSALEKIVGLTFDSPLDPPPYNDRSHMHNKIVLVNRAARQALDAWAAMQPDAERVEAATIPDTTLMDTYIGPVRLQPDASQAAAIQDDMRTLLELLGLPTHARDKSPREVMQGEIIPAVRGLVQPDAERGTVQAMPIIEVRQMDWIPGFAAFVDGAEGPQGEAQVVLNVGALVAAVDMEDIDASEVPYFVAESIMHEVMHVLEKWAGVEFSEDRIEALTDRYRAAASGAPESVVKGEAISAPAERAAKAWIAGVATRTSQRYTLACNPAAYARDVADLTALIAREFGAAHTDGVKERAERIAREFYCHMIVEAEVARLAARIAREFGPDGQEDAR